MKATTGTRSAGDRFLRKPAFPGLEFRLETNLLAAGTNAIEAVGKIREKPVSFFSNFLRGAKVLTSKNRSDKFAQGSPDGPARMLRIKIPASAIAVLIVTALAGCNADPGARQEIQLLKAEILDLEDRYYALKSRCGEAATDEPLRENNYAKRVIERDTMMSRPRRTLLGGALFRRPEIVDEYEIGVTDSGTWIDDGFSDGEVIYQDGFPNGNMESPGVLRVQDPVPAMQTPESILNGNSSRQNDVRSEEIELPPASDDPDIGSTAPGFRSIPARQASSPTSSPAVSPGELTLHGNEITGFDPDGNGVDDGLVIAFSLTDVEGNAYSQPAEIVFSLMDPELPNGQQRIELWKHTVPGGNPPGNQAVQKVALPWQKARPRNEYLLLFARCMLPDGRAIEASTQVNVRVQGEDAGPPRLVKVPPADRTSRNPDNKSSAPQLNFDLSDIESQNNNGRNRRRSGGLWNPVR